MNAKWNKDALERLEKIPDEIRPFARGMVEQYAEQEGIETITEELIVNLRRHFEKRYGEQQKCPLFSDGDSG